MLSVDAALNKILTDAKCIDVIEEVSLSNALNRTLAADQISSVDVPPADNSAMDGYAINTEDLSGLDATTLPIMQIITAGSMPAPLASNTAARIFTGAEIPEGANAVVMQEDCREQNGSVTVADNIPKNNNIRPRAQDIRKGEVILKKGKVLHPQDLSYLASVGIPSIPVFRQLKVAILSTGDELVEPGECLKRGQIYNSNRYFLNAFLSKLGITSIDLGIIKDNLEDTISALEQASTADCIISSGGASVGDEDYIKQAVLELGELNLWRIAIKPGKPLAFGHIKQTPFFGLPGNPVSSFVTFLLFVKPYLCTLQGQGHHSPLALTLKANFSSKANLKRQEYLRVSIKGNQVYAYKNQSSGVLSSIVNSNGFAVIPKGKAVAVGDMIQVIPFSQLF
jgi:molybdopterin molybdotransferase